MSPNHPLGNIRVADFTRVLSGPSCTRVLTDLGAEVVKVEPPDGDMARRLGRRRSGMSGYFMQQNCGKLNVSIDLKSNAGRDLARELVAASDVLVENYRPGVMASHGLGPDELLAEFPRLIYCSISGFGHSGPWKDRRAFAGIVHATTGVLHRQAYVSGGAVTDSPLAIGDTVTGLHAVIAVMAALRHRDQTGEGQWIDLAMHDSLLSVQEAANFHLFADDGSDTDFLSSWIYRCDDEHVAMPTDPRAHWAELTAVMDRPELLTSPLYATVEARNQRLDELEALIQAWVSEQTSAADVVRRLEEADLPGAVVLRLSEALDSPQTVEREMTPLADDRSGNQVRVVNTPYRFSKSESGLRGTPAYRGEDNREVLLRILGKTEAQFQALSDAGVISDRCPSE